MTRQQPGPAAMPGTGAYTNAGSASPCKERAVIAHVAVARELDGGCWSLAVPSGRHRSPDGSRQCQCRRRW